jgi:hypothetical protein
MSTKTTFKRIALVAVASLGFGVLTSVAPANAAETAATEVAITTPGTGRVGSVAISTVSVKNAVGATNGDTMTLRARFDSKPAGSTAVVGFSTAGNALLDSASAAVAASVVAAGAAGNELLPARYLLNSGGAAKIAANTSLAVAGSVGFTPDVVGDYKVTVWNDSDNDGLVGSAETYSTKTFTVGNAVVSVKVTSITGTALIGANTTNGALVKLELLDAAGAVSGLASNEAIRLSPSSSTTDITKANGSNVSHTAGAASYVDLVAANFVKGVSYVNITDSAAATVTVSIAGQGGSVTAVSGTFTQKFVAGDTVSGNTATTVLTTGGTTAATYGAASNYGVAGSIANITFPVGAKSFTYLTTLTAGVTTLTTDAYLAVTITDNSGYTTGAIAQGITTDLAQDKALLLTESATTAGTFTTSFTVATSGATVEKHFTISIDEYGTATTSDATAVAVVTTSNGALTVSPSAALSLKIGSSITYAVTVKDDFGRVLPNASVKMVTTGRNANQTITPPTAVTSSTGVATFTLTDAPLVGTSSLTDSIVFTATGYDGSSKAATAVTIAWSATGPVATTVTVTTGTEDDTATSITYRDIAAGSTGAQAGAATVTATVKDASGNLLAGVPVTFSTASAGAAVLSTSVVGYTSAAGTVTASVYGWTAGAKTFTATAGAATGSGTVNYKQQTVTDVRTIAAKVEGSIVTVTATDRFGNTVEGVKIYGTKTGTGYFGNGSSTSSATTDKTGAAEFVVQGSGSFKFAAGDATAADILYGDTDALAGFVGATAVTASTTGTATTAETGIGATFAAAGVNSVTLDISVANAADAAADAAAEATDAANAATDAANAAAEAADAATAAAQDAADAVAALSASVTEMVNALKKQITALTNLVIKIQKKVKA